MKSWIAAALIAGMFGVPGLAQPVQSHKLSSSDGAAADQFGGSIAVSGSTAVVGAFGDDDKGDLSGSAYVFDVTTGQQLHKLLASDGALGDQLGISVAVSGSTAVVGALGDDDKGDRSGSVYVFDVTTGQQLHKLLASDGAAGDEFGISVAVSGSTAVVGARFDDDNGFNSGSAYVFDVTTGQQLHKLLPSDGALGDFFGWSVVVSGTLAVIGALGDDDNGSSSGSAYVFDVTTGQQQHKLLAGDGAADDLFGMSVAVSGDIAVVGSHADDDKGDDSGSAYVFDVTSGQQIHKLLASDGAADDFFGHSVAVSGNLALIGAYLDDDNASSAGSSYVFDVTTGQQLQKLLASDGALGDVFGFSVALSGSAAAIGAHGDDDNGSNSGSAYVFDLGLPFVPYGTGCFGTGGVFPELALSGSATPGGQIQLDLLNGVGSGTAFVFMGLQQASTNMGFGCALQVAPLLPVIIGPLPLVPFGAQGAGAGSISIPGPLPSTIVPPITITFQAFVQDPGGNGGYSNTNGVELNIQ